MNKILNNIYSLIYNKIILTYRKHLILSGSGVTNVTAMLHQCYSSVTCLKLTYSKGFKVFFNINVTVLQ